MIRGGNPDFPPLSYWPADSSFKALVQSDSKSKIEFGVKKHVPERPPESICITHTNPGKKISFDFFFWETKCFRVGGSIWLRTSIRNAGSVELLPYCRMLPR